ncbi:ATP-dependent translocase ABCB1 isoform X2 [Parasteatoda tepidariorum]|uniref:ATP-dependent translocase ABCB1 isoform X2 n=1 Tax=Parasteatoda tepidariorum TaxID=114398 RepID=UPI0039BD3C3A
MSNKGDYRNSNINGFQNGKDEKVFEERYINKAFDDNEYDAGCSEKKEKEEKPKDEFPPVAFFSLFKYSSACDKLLMIIACIIAIASGCSMPGIMIIFGKVIQKMITYDMTVNNVSASNMTREDFLESATMLCIYNAAFGGVMLICNYIFVCFFNTAAASQAFRIRCLFMSSVLKQDIGWYDTHETGDFASRITGDLTRIQDGMGEKVGICLSFLSSTFLCVGVGLYYGWKLGLVILAITPVTAIAMAVMAKIQANVSREEMQAYGAAGAVAEEVLSSIRTVSAFGGEIKEIQRYENRLLPAMRKGIKRGLWTALGASITWFSIFAGYALAFWYGVQLIIEGYGQVDPEYDGGVLIIVFFNVMSASMFIGQTSPYFEAFALAKGAAAKIFHIIERKPVIDSSSEEGLRPGSLRGVITLRDVNFNYPARKDVAVLKNMSLDVAPGETVALVGSSGCGKSTIIQLVLRFYDTDSGSVELDGTDVKDLNVGWLRDHIGLVGQEPVLFSTTILENIKYGKLDATQEEIETAAKIANAHNFIDALPLKYNTLVGERGTQLSGGQKQRIAIARALIKNPKILLLDEATSALDTESEAVVQAALDQARKGRTTIVVAHRLSTIRTADKIVALSEGNVKETGTHDELMKRKGLYYDLVVTQTSNAEEEEEEDDDLPLIEDRARALSISSDTSLQRRLSSASIPRPGMHRQISSGIDRQISVVSGYGRQISAYSAEKEGSVKAQDEEEEEKADPPKTRLLQVSAPEWPFAVIGGLAAMCMGLHMPAFGIIFGSILGVLAKPPDQITDETNFWCLIFVVLGITSFICTFLQMFMFSVAGEKLTSRLRKMVFANIITQDMSFFDNSKNSVGALCSRLTSDASQVQGATGARMSTLFQALSTFVFGIILAMWYDARLGGLTLAFMPFVLLGAYFEGIVVSGQSTSEKAGTEAASKVAIEAIESIRTVASLHQEKNFYHQFYSALLKPLKNSRKMAHIRGLIYGFAQGLNPFSYAAVLYYGSILVADQEMKYEDLLKVLEGVLIGMMMVGQAIAIAPDYNKAKLAAVRIFKLLDIVPSIDPLSPQGKILNEVRGNVDFQKVYFNYPSRSDVRILRGLNLAIEPGKTVALVGSSGCGKSTCVQLIERFYDPWHGNVMLDEENVLDIKVANLRSHIGLVSQEPVLFSYSIAENIAYGDNSRSVEMQEIIEASRQANIHTFISSLPQGYDTPVGDKGTQLSGGQKQRVAIARALLRNPKILLLDEATSALDAESEKVVQEALDKASSGRTCLIIAHRLSTIQNADTIVVIHKGKIVEKGTHQELLNLKGHYYNLHNTQSGVQ